MRVEIKHQLAWGMTYENRTGCTVSVRWLIVGGPSFNTLNLALLWMQIRNFHSKLILYFTYSISNLDSLMFTNFKLLFAFDSLITRIVFEKVNCHLKLQFPNFRIKKKIATSRKRYEREKKTFLIIS